MLYREIIAVCSEIHTKHINTLCGQSVGLLNGKLVVHIVTSGIWKVNLHHLRGQDYTEKSLIWERQDYCNIKILSYKIVETSNKWEKLI